MRGIIRAWGTILRGGRPSLSIEITRECPLRCPGCYAYGDDHLGGTATLRTLSDFKGDELVRRVLALVDEHDPLHVSIVGGEPLVRFRELDEILPALSSRGIHVQLVTSAVRPIPIAWRDIRNLKFVVSIDGLQPEHDARRAPATYDRILQHIAGHRITVHCTVTRQQTRPGYLEEFVSYWSAREEPNCIWCSLYTPQVGEVSDERLTPQDRAIVIEELRRLGREFPKLEAREGLLNAYERPPSSPDECVFARTTTCVSADFEHIVTPCQFGGRPDCENCGCIASAALAAVGRHELVMGLTAGHLFEASLKLGQRRARRLEAAAG